MNKQLNIQQLTASLLCYMYQVLLLTLDQYMKTIQAYGSQLVCGKMELHNSEKYLLQTTATTAATNPNQSTTTTTVYLLFCFLTKQLTFLEVLWIR